MHSLVIAAALTAALLLPSAAFAQETAPVTSTPPVMPTCGSAAIDLRSDGAIVNMGQQAGDPASNAGNELLNLSSVHGMVVHAEGDLLLLKLPTNQGQGNATSTYNLAGRDWAVVRLPADCSLSDVPMGSDVLAVGTPNASGILEADRLELHG